MMGKETIVDVLTYNALESKVQVLCAKNETLFSHVQVLCAKNETLFSQNRHLCTLIEKMQATVNDLEKRVAANEEKVAESWYFMTKLNEWRGEVRVFISKHNAWQVEVNTWIGKRLGDVFNACIP